MDTQRSAFDFRPGSSTVLAMHVHMSRQLPLQQAPWQNAKSGCSIDFIRSIFPGHCEVAGRLQLQLSASQAGPAGCALHHPSRDAPGGGAAFPSTVASAAGVKTLVTPGSTICVWLPPECVRLRTLVAL